MLGKYFPMDKICQENTNQGKSVSAVPNCLDLTARPVLDCVAFCDDLSVFHL